MKRVRSNPEATQLTAKSNPAAPLTLAPLPPGAQTPTINTTYRGRGGGMADAADLKSAA